MVKLEMLSTFIENWSNQFCKNGQTSFQKLLAQLSDQIDRAIIPRLSTTAARLGLSSFQLPALASSHSVAISAGRPDRAIVIFAN